jgi:type I restriction enzyme S subunit
MPMLERPVSKAGWTRVRFDQIATQINDRVDNPAEAGVERYVGLEHLDPDSLRIRRWGEPTDVESTKLRFQPGDIIFGKRRVYQRKVAVADFEGICSAHAMVLRGKTGAVLPEFLPFFMQSDLFMERALSISVGSLSPTINWKALAAEEFLLPPIQEQARLVEALTAYVCAQQSMIFARDALLVAAQSLTDQAFQSSASTKAPMVFSSLVKADIIEFQTGPFGTVLAASEYTKSGWPIVNPSNISSGEVSDFDGPHVDDETAMRLEKYRIRPGDILLSRKGEIDKACLSGPENDGWIVGSDLIRIRPDGDRLRPNYLFHFLQSSAAKRMLRSHAHGTIMAGINEKMLGALAIQIPALAEQDSFLSKMELGNL